MHFYTDLILGILDAIHKFNRFQIGLNETYIHYRIWTWTANAENGVLLNHEFFKYSFVVYLI